MADDSNITITLAANTAGVQTALSEAIGSFQRMRQEMQYVSDASKALGESVVASNRSWLEAASSASDYQQRLTYLKETLAATQAQQQEGITQLNELTAAMAEQRGEMAYLADATQLLGADQAELNMSWLLAADNTSEYTARLSYLREQLALVRQEQNMMQESLGSMGSGEGLVGSFSALSGLLGGLGNMITGPLGALGGFLSSQSASVFTGMLGMQLFNAGYQGLRNFFADGLFGLNKQTEQNVYSWRYTYGKGMNPTDAMANANAISKWSQDYSMDIPFTRQSLMTAISGAAPLGLDKAGLEHYFPIFSDLAATHINPFTGQPVDLGTVVQAVRGAEMGYSRMLKYDLNITPEDLVKYGLAGQGSGMGFKITDMSTLLPALEKYSEDNGWTNMVGGHDKGAAYNTAHATFWGAWSSFLDRIQNWELSAGGGPFEMLKNGLNFVSDWWDNHKDELNHIATVFGTMLTGAVKDLGQAFGGLFDGLGRAGIGKAIMDDMTNAGRWLADPNNQANIRNFAAALGQNLGDALSTLGSDFDKVSTGLGHLKDSISPAELQALKDALGALGSIIQTSVQVVAGLADLLADYNLEMQAVGNGDVAGANHYRDRIGQDIQYIFGGAAPGPDNYGKTQPVDPNSASSGSVSVDANGNPVGTPTINGPSNGQSTGDNANPYSGPLNARSQYDLSEILGQITRSFSNGTPDQTTQAGLHGYITQLLADIAQNGSPFGQTNDPKLLALQQQIMNNVNQINNPTNATTEQQAYNNLMIELQQLQQYTLKNGKSGGMFGTPVSMAAALKSLGSAGDDSDTTLRGFVSGLKAFTDAMAQLSGGSPSTGAGGASAGGPLGANILAALHNDNGGLGSGGAQKMGSDFVQNLATGMQTKLPVISSTSQTIGTNIAQQIMQGAMQSLGVGSGGGSGGAGGISGIGPGSTLGDLVKWTVAEALQGMQGGVWGDGHTPGGFSHFGTYGFN